MHIPCGREVLGVFAVSLRSSRNTILRPWRNLMQPHAPVRPYAKLLGFHLATRDFDFTGNQSHPTLSLLDPVKTVLLQHC